VVPEGGKCSKCGAQIPPPARSEPKSIDEELQRLSEKRETCPTCGKLLPVGSRLCPSCRAPEPEVPTRHGPPVWISLLIVVAFAAIVGGIVYHYTVQWGHDQHVEQVKAELESARQAAAADKVREAVLSLESARKRLEWFDPEDPDREMLLSEIDRAGKELRVTLAEKLKQMIKRDEVGDAQKFYETEIKSIDTDGSLLAVVNKAIADNTALQEFRKSLKLARKLHEDGSLGDALKEISTLRTKVQDPLKARALEAMAELRTIVDDLQSQWVKEAFDKGQALLDNGKFTEAAPWFEMARQYVWSSEVTLKRKVQDVLYLLSEKRVVGVVINLGPVRVVAPETVRAEIMSHLGRKLGDEGFLMLVIAGPGDPKAKQLARMVTVNYKEEKGRDFTSETGPEKAAGTRITCDLKVTPVSDSQVLWQDRVVAETGAIGGVGRGAFNDAALRDNAVAAFWRAFDAVRIPNANLLP
jgi:tetratricopeptide (TPR) repeat protein/RNA polymerase subunit RPABC4/transcription elongation factor Spt4